MTKVVIIGCGVVGATIAYELSQIPELNITVVDKQSPAQGATSASLGVVMGVVTRKLKGKAWQLRETSIQRYETLIPELEAITQRQIPYNRLGILMLCLPEDDLTSWQELLEIRRVQGWQLEIWDVEKVKANCPHLNVDKFKGAVYSPQDRQVNPTALTLALVDAAQRNGVNFHFNVNVSDIESTESVGEDITSSGRIKTTNRDIDFDWLVISAGLGSTPLMASLQNQIDIRPVLGQALHLRLPHPLGNADFQPVISGDDVHIVPLGEGDYWVGATVEFPVEGSNEIVIDASQLEVVKQEAIAFCPPLAQATIIRTWSGLRPRPEGRPAPIIGNLPGYRNILLATGHYRNGILLAPATAQAIREAILG